MPTGEIWSMLKVVTQINTWGALVHPGFSSVPLQTILIFLEILITVLPVTPRGRLKFSSPPHVWVGRLRTSRRLGCQGLENS